MEIKPVSGFTTSVEINQEKMILDEQDTISLMENAKAAGYQVALILRDNGYNVTADVQRKALELAGLESFAAAKQIATGKIII